MLARRRRARATGRERFCIGYFDEPQPLLRAAAEARRRGYEVLDAFMPYHVHGLPDAMGFRPSRLGWIGVGAGIIGLACGLVLQFWTSVYDWPLIVGGQPFNAWPVFIPVSFELTVMFSGIIGVLALLIGTRLWPGHRLPTLRRVSDSRFALALVQRDSALDPTHMAAMLRECGAVEVEEGDELA